MNVIFGIETANKLEDRMTVLELDTFLEEGLVSPITAYAVLDMNDVPLEDISQLKNLKEMHNTMWVEYKKKNFAYCEQAVEHLKGRWKGSLDSFYDDFLNRIQKLSVSIPENWDGIIRK